MIPAIIGAASVAGSIYQQDQANKARKSSEREMDALSEEWRKINMPDLSPIEFERYKQVFIPQILQDSEMGKISTDPAYKEAQMAALSQLGDISQGGLTLQDKANLLDLQNQAAQQDAGRQGAITQGMAERGMGGAGAELAQKLMSQQGAANRGSAAATDIAANAQARALEAIMQRGRLGGSMRDQEFGEQADKARAQDAINQFNTNTLNEEQRLRQRISDRNADLTTAERGQGNRIAQDQYNNEMDRMTGYSNVKTARNTGTAVNNASRQAGNGAIVSGVTQMIPGMASLWEPSDQVANSPTTYAGPPQEGDAEAVFKKRQK